MKKIKFKLYFTLKKMFDREGITEHNERILKGKLKKLLEKVVYDKDNKNLYKVSNKEGYYFIVIKDKDCDIIHLGLMGKDYYINYNDTTGYYKRKELNEILNFLENTYGNERHIIKKIDSLCALFSNENINTKQILHS